MARLDPVLERRDYVFCSSASVTVTDLESLQPFAVIREAEGMTLLLERQCAEQAGFRFAGVYRKITLGVHSSLQAVGLTAAVSTALAGQGISANMIAACHHDHVFVPAQRAEEALAIIRGLS